MAPDAALVCCEMMAMLYQREDQKATGISIG